MSLNSPNLGARRVLVILYLLLFAFAAWLFWRAVMPTPAHALSYGSVCYEDREETWLEFSRTIVVQDEVVELEHQLAKFTRERTQESVAGWQRYSFVKPGGWAADTPPPGPSEKPQWWQANVAGDPHGIGQEGPYFRSSGNSGKGDWFYLEATQAPGPWSEWSEPTVWEPLSHETWVTEIPEPDWQSHHRSPGLQRDWALLPTGYADTVVVTPEVTETETEWFASPPEDDWTPTGNSRSEWIEVEVPCPPLCACLPVEGVPCDLPPECAQPPACPGDPECEAPEGPETPPTTVDESFEAEADHTIPPTDPPVEEVVTSSISTERTLPRTGVKEDIASVGLVLLFVGGSLLGIEAYDRRKRREA